ncbi:hypothetical protein MSPP1_000504 [Malassezia sp. CBS 17886]|nr:hypothetical protein MSPP1_000504 [Malassezia sp. CBS 17886]
MLDWVVKDTPLLDLIILFYAFTIVYGRLYGGMHSAFDCAVGSIIGIAVALLTIALDGTIYDLVHNPSLLVPLGFITVAALGLYIHPLPISPCPCYEDVVAFVGAWVGVSLGEWRFNSASQRDEEMFRSILHPLVVMVPAHTRLQIVHAWSQFICKPYSVGATKLFLCVFPIIIWKIVATPFLKALVFGIYRTFFDRKQASSASSVPTPASAVSTGLDAHRETELRQRAVTETLPVKTVSVLDEGRILDTTAEGRDMGEKVCRDIYRLLVYIGIGMAGTWSIPHLRLLLGLGVPL